MPDIPLKWVEMKSPIGFSWTPERISAMTNDSKVGCNPTIAAEITIRLTEDEAAALHALTEYGVDPFLRVFYNSLGTYCLQLHEAGLRSLFQTISGSSGISRFLQMAKDARAVFQGTKVAVRIEEVPK